MIASAGSFNNKGTTDTFKGDSDQSWVSWISVLAQDIERFAIQISSSKRQVFRPPIKFIMKNKATAGRPQRSARHTSRNVWINT